MASKQTSQETRVSVLPALTLRGDACCNAETLPDPETDLAFTTDGTLLLGSCLENDLQVVLFVTEIYLVVKIMGTC